MARLLLRLIIVCTLFGVMPFASDIEDLCDSDDPTVKRICQYFLFNSKQSSETEPKVEPVDNTVVQIDQTAVQSLQSLTQVTQVTPDANESSCIDPIDWAAFEARVNVTLIAHQEQISIQSESTEQLSASSEDLTLRVVQIEQSLNVLQESRCTCTQEPAPQRAPSSMKGEDFIESDSVRQDLLKVQYDLQRASENWQSSFKSKAKDLERSIGSVQSDLSAIIQQQDGKIEAQSSQMGQIKSQMLDQLAGVRHYFMKTVTDFYERMLERQNAMNQRLNSVTNELSAVKHRGGKLKSESTLTNNAIFLILIQFETRRNRTDRTEPVHRSSTPRHQTTTINDYIKRTFF